MVVHAEAGESPQCQVQPGLLSKSQVNQGYIVRLCLKKIGIGVQDNSGYEHRDACKARFSLGAHSSCTCLDASFSKDQLPVRFRYPGCALDLISEKEVKSLGPHMAWPCIDLVACDIPRSELSTLLLEEA